MHVHFENEQGDARLRAARDRDRRAWSASSEPIFGDDFAFLQSAVTQRDARSSRSRRRAWSTTAAAGPRLPRRVPDLEEFWDDLAAAYAEQIGPWATQGCTYLQLDDTSLAYLNDPRQRARRSGRRRRHLHLRNIAEINAALRGRPEGMTVTTHMCRGNFRFSWVAEGGYDFVAEALFSELDVDGFFLEYDDVRSGGFEPLRFVPPGKEVVLGLVTPSAPTWRRRTT